MSGSVLALNEHPDQYHKLAREPGADRQPWCRKIIRWQTPVAAHAPHRDRGCRARRKAHQEGRPRRHVVCLGQPRRGRRSTSRTEFIIDRGRPRQHLSFRLRHEHHARQRARSSPSPAQRSIACWHEPYETLPPTSRESSSMSSLRTARRCGSFRCMPQGMQNAGTAMHRAASRFSIAAKQVLPAI